MRFAIPIILLLLSANWQTVLAGEVTIENNVSSSASMGGNSVGPGGEVIQGESKVRVKIYTEIDGVVVEKINRKMGGGGGKKINETVEPPAPSTGAGQADEDAVIEKRSFMATFLSKIFNYVFSIF